MQSCRACGSLICEHCDAPPAVLPLDDEPDDEPDGIPELEPAPLEAPELRFIVPELPELPEPLPLIPPDEPLPPA